MRLLWLGDLGATGFATVTMDMTRALLDEGVDVRVFQYRDEGAMVPAHLVGRVVTTERDGDWLTFDETMGAQEVMRAKIRRLFTAEGYEDGWSPETVVVLGDPASVIRSELVSLLPDGLPAYHYVPIEGIGIPPYWRTMWARITPIAMAKSGAKEIGRLMGAEPDVVYHGVDTDTFYPASPSRPIVWPDEKKVVTSRADAKRAFGIDPKTTVLLRCDANMPRKAYGSLFRAVAPVLAAHDDLLLIVHARRIEQGGNLDEMRSHFPPHIAGRIAVPDFHDKYGGLPRYALATLYNAADIYVSNSCEGFGLTIAEALACGVACVGLDFSAVPEVIGPAGLVVRPGRLIENIYAHWWAVADEEAFGQAVDSLVRDRSARWRFAALGPPHVKANFTWPLAAQALAGIVGAREAVAA